MKFNDFEYKRPVVEDVKKEWNTLLEILKRESTAKGQIEAVKRINDLRRNVETMMTLVQIRHSVDSNDEFYKSENEYIDEVSPVFQGLETDFYKVVLDSPYIKELKEEFGEQFFALAKASLNTFKDEIIDLLVKENKLCTEYDMLLASAKLDYKGEEKNLSQMRPFLESKDRQTRIEAFNIYMSFFEENEDKFDTIYDELVKVRTQIAKELGYKNFVELGYDRMRRTDYNSKDVKGYRDQIHKELVPLAEKLKERKKNRIGIPDYAFYDEALEYTTGNATPKGGPKWILDNGIKMYRELSPESAEFIDFMVDKELLELEAKKGKRPGGYCTFIADYKAPFIFSNFNGTSGDIDVLTHEAGHAFQVYMSRDFEVPEYGFPTYEACEIHSMSMEFITWPWMDSFFKEDVEKYKYSHLADALCFIPYGVAVDEFQHFVYENPESSPKDRKSKWREIEKKYLPSRNYADNDLLNRGGYWFRQAHIFVSPFYYIDYTLAQVCAFQYWNSFRKDREKAWDSYLALCKAGGSLPFTKLVELAGLDNPFKEGTVKNALTPIMEYLDGVDDTKL